MSMEVSVTSKPILPVVATQVARSTKELIPVKPAEGASAAPSKHSPLDKPAQAKMALPVVPNPHTPVPTTTGSGNQRGSMLPNLSPNPTAGTESAAKKDSASTPKSGDESQASAIVEVAPSDATSPNGATTGSINIEPVAVPPPSRGGETADEPKVSEEERLTTNEIIILWTEHNKQHASLKKRSKELKATRTALGEYLYQLKNLLAKTGRNGRWTSFLNGEGIPRATADRYVEAHKRFLDRKNGKRLTEAISVPTEDEIKEMVAKLTPRLVRVLTTPESTAKFLREMAAALQPSASAA
jgi:hypothetical protein